MSRRELGERIGVGLKQVNKYEAGTNRVSAGRLYDISRVLNVPAAYFFEDGNDAKAAGGESQSSRRPGSARDVQALLDAYYAMPRGVRGRFLRLVRSVAEAADHS